MELKSTGFENGGKFPKKYTCEGSNVSPPLEISGVPPETKTLALIMYDPDIPQVYKDQKGIDGWDHWSVWNIDASTSEIGEGSVPTGSTQGKQSGGDLGYTGPCPPKEYQPSEHRYFFWLYALDSEIDLGEGAGKAELENAMEGHILEKAELMGLYEKEA